MKRVKVIINYFCCFILEKLSTIFSYLFTNFCWPAPYIIPKVTALAAWRRSPYNSATSSTSGSLNTLCAYYGSYLHYEIHPLVLHLLPRLRPHTSAVVKSIATILWPGDALIHPFTVGLSRGNCCMFNLPEELRRPLVVPCRLKPVRR